MTTGIIILVIVVLLAIWCVSLYNNLVKLRNNRENAFANIDVQLKLRHDLVPQLVATVKGYATHEREVLQRVTEARTAAMGATTINDKINAENALTSALAGLKVSLEAYPDLKATRTSCSCRTRLLTLRTNLPQYADSSIRQQESSTTPLRHSRQTSLPKCSDLKKNLCSRFHRKNALYTTRHLKLNSNINRKHI